MLWFRFFDLVILGSCDAVTIFSLVGKNLVLRFASCMHCWQILTYQQYKIGYGYVNDCVDLNICCQLWLGWFFFVFDELVMLIWIILRCMFFFVMYRSFLGLSSFSRSSPYWRIQRVIYEQWNSCNLVEAILDYCSPLTNRSSVKKLTETFIN